MQIIKNIIFIIFYLFIVNGCYSNISGQETFEGSNNFYKVDNDCSLLLQQNKLILGAITFNYFDRINLRKDRGLRNDNIDDFLKEQFKIKLNKTSKNEEQEIYYIDINIDYDRKYGEDVSSLISPFVIYKINIFDKENNLLKIIKNNNVEFKKYLSLDESDEKEFIIELIDIIIHDIENTNNKD
ncbi:MAG: hypothetical protein RBQ81_08870 [Arcobacteraceae bacterium]|nr:hypothetical protein [Arcobacteraceae bacterium]